MLTNDAFRELVQQGGKTTKEIARDAVEQEFQRNQKKLKRRRTNQDSSDDDNDDTKHNNNNKKKNKNDKRNGSTVETEAETSSSFTTTTTTQYRDRAKERRDGTSNNSSSTTTGAASAAAATQAALNESQQKHEMHMMLTAAATTLDAEMTKFLGGDEAHTHLVRGLDVTLARKVKREMKEQEEAKKRLETKKRTALLRGQALLLKVPVQFGNIETLDTIVSDTAPDMEQEESVIESASKAMEKIRTWTPIDLKTSLGMDMLAFLKQQYLPQSNTSNHRLTVGPAGLALQRSSYTFSCRGHPGDVRNAWEVPDEDISMDFQNLHGETGGGGGGGGDGVLSDASLLLQIKQAFDRRMSRQSAAIPPTSSTGKIPIVNTADQHRVPVNMRTEKKEDEDSSDDDIFADAGDYVPASVLDAPPSTGATSTTMGSSTFAGLLPQRIDDEDDQPAAPDFNIIAKIVQKSRVQATTNNTGGDFSQYHGEYGEDDMDVDFAGQLEDDEEGDTNKKKKKKEESTMASREYGKRGKPLKDMAVEE